MNDSRFATNARRVALASLTLLASALLLSAWAKSGPTPAPAHSPTETAPAGGPWVSLFDGRTMNHWQDPSKFDPPGDAWTIADGCLKAVPRPRITEDLMSDDTYTNFEVEFEWRVADGGNSGFKYRIQALPILTPAIQARSHHFEDQVEASLVAKVFSRSLIKPGMRAQIYVVGFEYQTIAGNHPDALRGPLYQSGALYGMVPPVRNAMRPVAEFNQSRLVVRGNHIEHWLNGEKVVDAELNSPDALAHTAHRWGASSQVYKLLSEQPVKACHISLQNHGDSAWFRNIRIRRLP